MIIYYLESIKISTVKGFNVTGVFMKNWDIKDETGICQTEEDYEDAQWVCKKLDIPLVEVNFVKEYWNNIFSYVYAYLYIFLINILSLLTFIAI